MVEMRHIQRQSKQRRWETETQTREAKSAQASVGGPRRESQCSAGSRFCEVCGAESRRLFNGSGSPSLVWRLPGIHLGFIGWSGTPGI